MNNHIILASASPRRRELLSVITDNFEVIPSGAEETVPNGIGLLETAEYLARIKAKDIAEKHKDAVVIGADTCVIAEGEILGKPKDKTDAYRMIKILSGKTHSVVTGCAVICNGITDSFSVETKVEFYPLSENEIEEYINGSEPYDKAGAYAIQGKASLFVRQINGDYFNVVGLPVAMLNKKLKEIL